ncbi:MAG: uroporphyrinogen decarboxylase [Alphaproteobacteria bacterium]|nr:uroporphyrinogen decarboxylase [Alphaproteobacteria bacterium]
MPVKLLLRALQGEVSTRPPFWLMRQAGRYLPEYRRVRERAEDFLRFCYTPDLAVEVTLQPWHRYGMDGVILFSDILVVPDALGQAVRFAEGQGPVLEPVRSVGDISRLSLDRLCGHLAPVFETIRRLSREISGDAALIGFAGAPWTLAVYMVEGHGGTDCGRARTWAYNAPVEFQGLIDLLVDATTTYLIEQVKNGVEVVQIFDSWAGVLSESQFRQWVIAPTTEIVGRFRAACPGVPVIGFPRGAGVLYKDYVEQTGVDGVSVDSTVPVQWAREALQGICTVQGNLDNQALVAGGQALDRETARILGTLAGGPFIFNLGHGILPETPPEHVARLAELVRGWAGR